MLFYVALTAVAAALSAAQDDDRMCPTIAVLSCMHLVKLDEIEGNGLEETAEMLDKYCEKTKPFMKCVVDFGAKCGSENIYYQYYKDQYSVLSRTCDKNDEFRTRYLNNAKCINTHRTQIDEKCGEFEDIEEIDEFTEEICGDQKGIYNCNFEEIDKNCGKEASTALKEIFSPATTFFEKRCGNSE